MENETEDTPDTEEKVETNVSVSAASDGREAIYVRPPVDPEIKKAIVKKGFRILSAQFAPDDALIYDGQTGKPENHQDTDEDAEVKPKPKPRAKKA